MNNALILLHYKEVRHHVLIWNKSMLPSPHPSPPPLSEDAGNSRKLERGGRRNDITRMHASFAIPVGVSSDLLGYYFSSAASDNDILFEKIFK